MELIKEFQEYIIVLSILIILLFISINTFKNRASYSEYKHDRIEVDLFMIILLIVGVLIFLIKDIMSFN